jgi:adenylate cyclase
MASLTGRLVKLLPPGKRFASERGLCYQRRVVRMLRFPRLVHALMALGLFLTVTSLWLLDNTGRGPRILGRWEYGLRDILTRAGRLNPPDSRLVFFARDSDSMLESDDLQFYSDNPPEDLHALSLITARNWSREVYALLCDRLLSGGARAVVLDIVFGQPDSGDDAFQTVLRKYPDRIILASDLTHTQQALAWRLPAASIFPQVSPEHSMIGYDTLFRDFDGKVRRALYQTTLEQLQGGIEPDESVKAAPGSLALRAATKLGPVNLTRPFQRQLFRYAGPPGTFPAVSLYEAFAYWKTNFDNGARIRGKVVLVGDSGSLLHDETLTPFGVMAGPEIHLNAINALLHHAFLHELPPWTGGLLIALAGVAAWLLTMFVQQTWLRFAAFVLLGTGYLFAIKLAHDHADTIILAIPPVLAFSVTGLVSFVYDFTHETLEKLRIRRTLEAYVSKDVVREVLDNPQSYLSKLGGQREKVALVVTDLRGFTTMSEQMDSGQLVAQLNEYLALMVDDIFSCRGSVDKFIGDAILAVWGHVRTEGPAQDVTLAVEAALLMKASLARLNATWQNRGLRTFQMGIGVNFGEVVFGNIGSSKKMEPTVIGDPVNVASRLEGLTKDYGRDLLVGEAAADLIGDSFRLQFVDKVTMKGKTRSLRIYAVVSRHDVAIDPQMTAYLEAYERAQVSYSAGHFKESRVLFENCLRYWPDDPLVHTYMERCMALLERPPGESWTGVHVAEHK